MKKRFVSLLLAISMILSLMPVSAVTAFAEGANNGAVKIIAEGNCGAENGGENLKWTLDNNGVLTISGDGAMGNYGYYNSPGWYQHTNEIKSVVFNGKITNIGAWAFYGYTNIKKVSYRGYVGTADNALPESVTTIGACAFIDTGVEGTLELPKNLTAIGSSAFSGCTKLTGPLVIPKGIKRIERDTFCECGFTGTLTIPEGVTIIEKSAFNGCESLTGNLTIPDTVTEVREYAFQKCSGLTGPLTIPKKVTKIGVCAFRYCKKLTGNLTIPDTVTEVGGGAFEGCSGFDGTIYISKSLKKIEKATFKDCSSLKGTLTIPDGVTTIEEESFNNCSNLTGELVIPNSVMEIGGGFVLGSSIFSHGAFEDCTGFTELKLSNNLTCIPALAFWGCSGLKGTLTIPASVTEIGYCAFRGCKNLTDPLIIPDQVKKIGEGAFEGCTGLTGDLTIPKNVTTIEENAFYNCGFTGSVDFSQAENLKVINEGTFEGCENLKKVYLSKHITAIKEDAFDRINRIGTAKIYYPDYKEAWLTLADHVSDLNDDKTEFISGYVKPMPVCYYCDVTFDPNGGTFADNTTAKTYQKIYRTELVATNEANASVPADPTRTGYTFNGWYYLDATKQKVTFDPATEGVPDTMTLYADWTQTGTTATVAISGITAEQELIKGKEYPFTVTVTPNDDTGTGKLNFGLLNNAELWYKNTAGQWEKVDNSTLSIDFTITEYQFKLVPKEPGANTLTVGVQKDGMTTGVANKDSVSFTVRDPKAAEIAIADLNNQTIKQNKPYTFTVTVTAHDDSGDMTVKFDSVEGLIYNDAPVTAEGITIEGLTAGEIKTLNLIITPAEAGNGKTLQATLNNDATDTATYNVSAYEHAKVTITGLDNTTVKAGKAKDFTVNVTPNDDTIDKVTFGTTSGEVQWSNDGGKTWTTVSGDVDYSGLTGKKFRVVPAADAANGTVTVTVIAKKADGTEVARKDASFTVTKKEEPVIPGGGSTGGSENPGENPGGNPGSGSTKPEQETTKRKLEIADGTLTSVTVKDENGNLKDITDTITKDLDGKYEIPVGAKVTITAKDAPEGMKFGEWSISDKTLLSDPDVPYTEKDLIFTMPDNPDGVKLSVVYLEESIGEEPNLLEKGALAGTVVVGSAALLYQGHMLGTELYLRYLLPHGAVIPQNRAELAVLLWQDAENPEPVSTTLHSDISDEDSAIQQAARWAVENDLMEQLDAEEHPDHFDPFVPVTFSDSIRAWKKAQELKKSVH
ncbi:leucine-rich repeat protein [Faecalibacterium duncaniae]|uniref:leucine-rich repeat protein n=1 Tax=Faecalibacterium duncaniae (strain DSM 17677 / JCM 31915 / A2-165) TaxID=411483 RepID=UPI003EDA056D